MSRRPLVVICPSKECILMNRCLSPSLLKNKKYIKGVQANLWTEYIPTFSQVEYMELPPYGCSGRSAMDNACEEEL